MNETAVLKQILANEGVVAIVTQSESGPHLVNTWNSYINMTEDGRLIYPAGGMKTTEENINIHPKVLLSVGSRNVEGLHGQGTGFLIKGNAKFLYEGKEFEQLKERFPWARAAVEIKISSMEQTL